VILPDPLPTLGRLLQQECLLRCSSNRGFYLRILGAPAPVAKRANEGASEGAASADDEEPMVGPQSQRRDCAAVGVTAALTKAHKHVIELCLALRRIPAACIPPPPLAAHEGCEPAG
uniref:HTH OST-type domain-containing protein n=1 Tax=Macrostomum lignano TaxID=282301 RepID=A0A1I8I556_9PLAT